MAARQQLALGFIWDSVTLTRTLEDRKLSSYLALLSEYAGLPTLNLRQMQGMAGKLHRMLMTLPPGSACLAASLFELMSGLKLPWHRRRTTRRVRSDFMLVHELLSANLGRGHYSYAHFRNAPAVWTDASKQARYSGGGWVSACGAPMTGSSTAAGLPGGRSTSSRETPSWRASSGWRTSGGAVSCSSSSIFQKCGAKGRSKAHRLNDLLRELLGLMIHLNTHARGVHPDSYTAGTQLHRARGHASGQQRAAQRT